MFGSTGSDLDATELLSSSPAGSTRTCILTSRDGRTGRGLRTARARWRRAGVTSFFDMPLNAQPPVLDKEGFLSKWNAAKAQSVVDFGLWGGLCPQSLAHLEELSACGVIGFKAFMAASGVDDFSDGRRRDPARRDAARGGTGANRGGARRERGDHRAAGAAGRGGGDPHPGGLPGVAAGDRRVGGDPAGDLPGVGDGLRAARRACQHGAGHRVDRGGAGPGAERVVRDRAALFDPDRCRRRTARAAGEVRAAAADQARAACIVGAGAGGQRRPDRVGPFARVAGDEVPGGHEERRVRGVGRDRGVPERPCP